MWLCMPVFVRFVLLVFVCVCSVVFGGCTSSRLTTLDAEPYTPDDVKAMVEKRFASYHPRLVLQASEVVPSLISTMNIRFLMRIMALFLLRVLLLRFLSCLFLVVNGLRTQSIGMQRLI